MVWLAFLSIPIVLVGLIWVVGKPKKTPGGEDKDPGGCGGCGGGGGCGGCGGGGGHRSGR